MDHLGEFRIHIKCDAMGISVLVQETFQTPRSYRGSAVCTSTEISRNTTINLKLNNIFGLCYTSI